MRLKEPLYGIRIAQMHWLIHLTLFATMCYVVAKFSAADFEDYVHQPGGKITQRCHHHGASQTGKAKKGKDDHASVHLLELNGHAGKHASDHVHLADLLLQPSNPETGEYYLRDVLSFGYQHLKNLDYKGAITHELTMLSGGGAEETASEYPVPDITLFYMLLSAHFISALFLFGEKYTSRYHNFPVLHGFFTNMICTCFYTLVVIYCIFKERYLKVKYPDSPECFTLVQAWLRFEIYILLTWLLACALFLLYASVYRFAPRWKRVEEELELQDVWCMKNSQDYLHHMKFEHEIFNLIAGPGLADLLSVCAHNQK